MTVNDKPARDLRIDFFRGVALLAIVPSHVDIFTGRWYIFFAPKLVHQLSDFAEVFVFLSGIVCGIVYGKKLLRFGFSACWGAALGRVRELWVTNMVALLTIMCISLAFSPTVREAMAHTGIGAIRDKPLQASLAAFPLLYAPALANVLPLYVILLLAMPATLWLMHRRLWLAVGVCTAVWLGVQLLPNLTPPKYPFDFSDGYPWGEGWAFNPFAWQAVFSAGLALGLLKAKGKLHIIDSRALAIFIVLALVALTIPWAANLGEKAGLWGPTSLASWHPPAFLAKKITMAPGRLLHLFAIAYLVHRYVPPVGDFWKYPGVREVVQCGQHSLHVFALGVVITYLTSWAILEVNGHVPMYGALTLLGWAALIAFAKLKSNAATIVRSLAAKSPVASPTKSGS